MQTVHKIKTFALLLGAMPLAVFAGESGTVYTQLNSNGLGLGYAKSVTPDWAVRGQYSTAKLSYSGNVGDFGSGNTLTVDVKFDAFQVTGDWYPAGEGFRLSAGGVVNNNKITVAGTGTVNNVPNVNVTAEVKMDNAGLAPYLGIGYMVKPKADKGFGFNFDLGVMFQNPKATLTASGGGVTEADRAAQERKMQDAVDQLKYMPVLGFGINYSF